MTYVVQKEGDYQDTYTTVVFALLNKEIFNGERRRTRGRFAAKLRKRGGLNRWEEDGLITIFRPGDENGAS